MKKDRNKILSLLGAIVWRPRPPSRPRSATLDLASLYSRSSIRDQRAKYFPIPVSIPSFSESGEFLATLTADPRRWRRGVDTREAMCECERWVGEDGWGRGRLGEGATVGRRGWGRKLLREGEMKWLGAEEDGVGRNSEVGEKRETGERWDRARKDRDGKGEWKGKGYERMEGERRDR